VPLDVVLHTDVYGKLKFRLRLSWLFGLVSREVTGRKKPEEKKKVSKGKQKPGEGRKRAGDIFGILRTRGLLEQLRCLLSDVLSRFKVRDLLADFRVGLGDPADTGLLFAFIGPATLWLNSVFPCQIRLQPSFEDEAVLEGYSFGEVRLLPIQMVAPVLRFAFSLATLRVTKKLVLTRWKRKK